MITPRTDGNVPLSKATLRMKCARVAQLATFVFRVGSRVGKEPMNMQVN